MGTTYREFVDNIEALVITGVTRRYQTGRPDSLNSADLPVLWVQLPRGTEGNPAVFLGMGGWPTMTADLVIAVNAVGQSTGRQNFEDSVDMMDNITAAIRANNCGMTKSKVTWSIILTTRAIAGNDYWIIITTITGNG